MALGLIGMLDLSIVTDRLIAMLKKCRDTSPLWTPANPKFPITVTGAAPDAVRKDGGCQLSLYLFHVSQDKFQKNSPVLPPVSFGAKSPHAQVPVIPFQPLSLDLFYLLTAFADQNYVHEQQAMSIALKCFHENPIIRTNVTLGPDVVAEEFCLTMEAETADELGRLWQAVTVPARFAVVYKVSVVFVTPPRLTKTVSPPPKTVGLSVDPASLPYAGLGQVLGTLRTVAYRSPQLSGVPQPDMRSFEQSPATAAPGQTLLLLGAGLDQDTAQRTYLLMPGGTEFEISSWVVPNPAPPPTPPPLIDTASRRVLQLPATVGAPPANTPEPGVYQLRVGSDAAKGDAVTYRSDSTPFSIGALLSVPAGPPPPPLLSPLGPTYTVNGLGFIPGQTEVLLDTIKLDETGGALAAGLFNVTATALTLQLPANLKPGLYTLRVRVNNVESAPTWWIQFP
jgi:hypothetical protein